jgi:PAS domain S-box-containing protein
MGYRKNPVSLEALRGLAKKRLQGHEATAATVFALPEAQALFEELQIHQIELELQNEHLNATRVQLEAALNQSNELYEFSPVAILSLDPMGAITKLNLAAANLLGAERARLLGSKLWLHLSDVERPVFNALLERTSTSCDVQGGEMALTKKGSLTTYVDVRIAPLPEGLGWQIILVDITERWRNEERWKLALEAAGDGVWDWNVQTGEVLFSNRFEQLFGFSENEFGRHMEDWNSRIHPDDRPRVMADIQAHLTGKTAIFFNEHRGQCKAGNWKWVLSRGAIVSRTAEGKALRMIGTHVDIMSKK